MKISFLIFGLLTTCSYAADMCMPPADFKKSDIRNEMGPLRNQGAMGWCYGFATADLMTHYLYKKKQIPEVNEDTMVSALSVSAYYNKKFYSEFSPEKELLLKKVNADNEKKKEAEKNSFFSKLNPFTGAKSETPAAIPVKSNIDNSLSELKPYRSFDLRQPYTKDYVLPAAARSEIFKMISRGARLEEAREYYFQSLRKLKTDDYGKEGIRTYPEGGIVYSALAEARNNFCLEKEARSGDTGHVNFDLKNLLKDLFDMTKTKNVSCAQLQSVQRMFPTVHVQDIATILQKSERANAYQALVGVSCTRKLSLNKDEPEILGWSLPAGYDREKNTASLAQFEMLKKVDEALNNGTPVATSYYSSFLTQENAPKVNNHVSSIVGKVFNPKTCKEEYIVRNSYGSGCAVYKKPNNDYRTCIMASVKETNDIKKNKMKSECDRKYPALYHNPKLRCEESSGYLFVEKEEMAKYTFGISYLKE